MALPLSRNYTAACISSKEVWDLIHRAILHQSRLGEETITDLLLLNLRERFDKNVVIGDFTKPQEGKEGADWEWWFVDSSRRGLGFRVQAKVMKLQGTRNPASSPIYEQLHYKAGSQTEKLIENAVRKGMVPMYCLYTFFDDNFTSVSGCSFYRNRNENAFGISLIGAEFIRREPHTNKLEDFFTGYMLFLACLLMHST